MYRTIARNVTDSGSRVCQGHADIEIFKQNSTTKCKNDAKKNICGDGKNITKLNHCCFKALRLTDQSGGKEGVVFSQRF